ncbi:insulinase family protein [Deltaproteobacteria bacterium TL4]
MKYYLKSRFIFCIIVLLIQQSFVGWAQKADQTDPRFPERTYRRFLLPNQMKVLIISDPTIHRSSAALSVSVGSLNNPPSRAGLAHFLEHMLFLGTKKYPEVGNYQNFISENDGYSNAFTTSDSTNYHFQISADHLEGALDRFSQFFVAPLFSPEFVKREMEAVDSEHSKNIPSDYWRMQRVASLPLESKHPEKNFSTGNLETLQGTTQEELLEFYNTHYSSNLMTLVVLGKENLDTLQQWIVPRFSGVINHKLPTFTYPPVLMEKKSLLRLLQVKTIKDTRVLQLFFPLPPSENYYPSKPLQTLGFLMGHEGKGSLLSLLKKKNLVTGLSAGGSLSTNSYSAFTISITLTPQGLENYKTVLQHVFEYIRLLRQQSLPEYIYNEMKQMAELDYQFSEKQEGTPAVIDLASLLHYVPMDQVEKVPFLYMSYDPKKFDHFLFRLTPDNMLVLLAARNVHVTQKETYYSAEYAYTQTPSKWLAEWYSRPLSKELHLPEKNKFIPQNLTLLTNTTLFKLTYQSVVGLKQEQLADSLMETLKSLQGKTYASWEQFKTEASLTTFGQESTLRQLVQKHVMGLPEKIMDAPQGEIWFQQDLRFQTPKAHLIFLIHTPETYKTPRDAVLSQLYVNAIEEQLNEFRYMVSLAGLDFSLSSQKKGIMLTFNGYSDRILELAKEISEQLKNVTLTAEIFDSLKEQLLRTYLNFDYQQPYQQALYFQNLILESQKYSIEQYKQVIQSLTLKQLQAYAKTLYAQNYIQGLSYGNLQRDLVKETVAVVSQNLGGTSLSPKERFMERIIQLPPSSDYTFSHSVPVNNSALVVQFQVGQTNPELQGALLVISKMLQPLFYTEMRTQQQLGYLLDAGMTQEEKTLGLLFLIQSGKYSPGELQQRVDAYFPTFIESLLKLPPNEVEALKKAVINAKLKKPSSIAEQASRLFSIAFEKEAQFDHVSEDILAVEKIQLETLSEVVRQYLMPPSRKRLNLRFLGNTHKDVPVNETPITSIDAFKAKHPCPEYCAP